MLRSLRAILRQFSVLALACKLVLDDSGRARGIRRKEKLKLVVRLTRNHAKIPNLTSLQQQLVMAREIIALPASVPGDVVECGCYNGGSTIGLSLACELAGRRLYVCDTFEGLPSPASGEDVDVLPQHGTFYRWRRGDFKSRGGLAGVRENVRRFGCLSACIFVPGLFAETLPLLPLREIAMVYEDADLASSVRDCIQYLWPKLQPGCKFFCQEPFSVPVVGLFYDRHWWQATLDSPPPGFFGSGGGIDYALSSSGLGYSLKYDPVSARQTGREALFHGQPGFEADD